MTEQDPEHTEEPTADDSGAAVSADLGVRFVARLIDSILLSIVFLVIIVPIVIVAIFSGSGGFGSAFGGVGFGNIVGSVIWTAAIIAYYAFLESSRGQTIGKMIMKLKTVGPDGGNPSLEMAAKRNIWYALGIIPILGGLAQLGAVVYIAITISQSDMNSGWHDKFAGGTRVIKIG